MYQIPKLLKYSGLYHAFSTVEEGNMANIILGKEMDGGKVLTNRKNFLYKAGIDIEKTISMGVMHGNRVLEADPKYAGTSMEQNFFVPKCDGLVTNKKEQYLFLLIADCLPIILYDPLKKTVGLVHSGWKGADFNIAGKVVNLLAEKYGSKPENIIAGFGPSARKESYIKDVVAQMNDPKWKDYLNRINGNKNGVDFVGLSKKQLMVAGLVENNIFDCGIDTIKDSGFYSHFRDNGEGLPDRGRFACVVGMCG